MSKRLWIMLNCLIMLWMSTVSAQQNVITLTINLPQRLRQANLDDVFTRFETRHAGVFVQIARSEPPLAVSDTPAFDLEAYLDTLETYITSADVLFVDQTALTPAAMEAEYYLDILPLARIDPTLDMNDFYPAMWQSFQWEGGLRALPVSGDLALTGYQPAVFDDARLSYPAPSWTLNDLSDAVYALSDHLAQPILSMPLTVLMGQTQLMDHATLSQQPRMDQPQLNTLLETWQELQNSGFVSQGGSVDEFAIIAGGVLNHVDVSDGIEVVALPEGATRLSSIEGFAVSSATPYPELAYELAAMLTRETSLHNPLHIPARHSLFQTATVAMNPLIGNATDEQRADLAGWLNDALPIAHYGDYLTLAYRTMQEDRVSADDALQAAQAKIRTDLQVAQQYQASREVRRFDIVRDADGLILRFGINPRDGTFVDTTRWQSVIDTFVETDASIAAVRLDTRPIIPDNNTPVDCFYTPEQPSASQLSMFTVPLNPLIDADPTFSETDVLPLVFDQLRLNGNLYGFPIDLAPQALIYDRAAYDLVNLPYPADTWDSARFDDAMAVLPQTRDVGVPVFKYMGFDNTYLLMLIAAYGGLPVDYTTDPPTIDFQSNASRSAIQSVLEMARDQHLAYLRLYAEGGGSGGRTGGEQGTEPVFYAGTWTRNSFLASRVNAPGSSFAIIPYPQNQAFVPVSFSTGAAYIMKNTTLLEPCYRFIQHINQYSELFDGMPARYSALNHPDLRTAQGDRIVDFYQVIADQLAAPGVIFFPLADENRYLDTWLNIAFDTFVLDGGPLDTALDDAQQRTQAYLACLAGDRNSFERAVRCFEENR